jgi:hypothetical protein
MSHASTNTGNGGERPEIFTNLPEIRRNAVILEEHSLYRHIAEVMKPYHEEMVKIDAEISKLNARKAELKLAALVETSKIEGINMSAAEIDHAVIC